MFGKSSFFPWEKTFPWWESFSGMGICKLTNFYVFGGKILATINGEQGGENILVKMLGKYFYTIALLYKQTTPVRPHLGQDQDEIIILFINNFIWHRNKPTQAKNVYWERIYIEKDHKERVEHLKLR